MPDINLLLEKSSNKKFKKSSYRPWNYMEEIQKEEEDKSQKQEEVTATELKQDIIIQSNIKEESNLNDIKEKNEKVNMQNEIIDNSPGISIKTTQLEENKLNENKIEQSISPLYSIFRLSGHQKTIFAFILERCFSRGLLSSGMITSEILTSITNTSLNMINTSIQRLVDKKLISRENGKRGRGGFYCFGISAEVKDAAAEYRRLITLDSYETRLNDSPVENFDLKRIEGRKFSTLGLPKEWEEIDIEPLYDIGFSRGHLIQLYKQEDLDVQSLQDSIYHFAYDLKYNNKVASITKSSPIGYFIAILKRSGIYNAPDNYESPKDKALRELLEKKRLEKEKREIMLKELINIAFEEWQSKLSQEEKDKIIPEEIRRGRLTAAKHASLKVYFTENIWIAPQEIDV